MLATETICLRSLLFNQPYGNIVLCSNYGSVSLQLFSENFGYPQTCFPYHQLCYHQTSLLAVPYHQTSYPLAVPVVPQCCNVVDVVEHQ